MYHKIWLEWDRELMDWFSSSIFSSFIPVFTASNEDERKEVFTQSDADGQRRHKFRDREYFRFKLILM